MHILNGGKLFFVLFLRGREESVRKRRRLLQFKCFATFNINKLSELSKSADVGVFQVCQFSIHLLVL